ncbi:MAG: alpha-galactosidase [Ruminococcaceae bacterium]|nr:alpha-galactosidase [Oscillospiraceae bacterium]
MSIIFNEQNKTFYLNGKGYSYIFRINAVGYPEHLHFGAAVPCEDVSFVRSFGSRSQIATPAGVDNPNLSYNNTLPEIAFFGTSDYREPTFLVESERGDRLCDLEYVGHDILNEKPRINGMPSLDGGETLVVHLKDKFGDMQVDLYYSVYDDVSVISRRIVYKNGGNTTLKLHRAYSFTLGFGGVDYDVVTFPGNWMAERTPERRPMPHGVISSDSKRYSSSATQNPFIMVTSKDATEQFGEAYGISLIYSSSFVLKAEGTSNGDSIVTGGINDFDFCWTLGAGEILETPEAVIAYSNEGIGGMSRTLHDTFREHLINKRFVKQPRPIVINNWEATYFNFDNEKLCAIVDSVEGTGIDTLVLDDGWFGERKNDRFALGDWYVNEQKLVGGIDVIIEHTHAKGMKFGLWFEPEMINEDSDLYRAHPDYAIGVPGRPRSYSRHQYCLDLTRKDVRDCVVEMINKMLREHKIDYVKWDYNRNVTDAFSVGTDPERQSEFAHRYALGLYDICERIINGNPHVFFEGCAGGGGRYDPAMLYYFPQIWTSDCSDADTRTKIQYGTSMMYPLSTMSCHVSAVPNHQTHRVTPMSSRANIAHLGATGYELDTTKFTDEDKAAVKAQVEEYKQIQDIVLEGDLYRIENPYVSNYFTEMVVSKDKSRAILCVYRREAPANGDTKRIRLQGLDKDKTYRIEKLGIVASGASLMNVGMGVNYRLEDYTSDMYIITEA